jgi:thimet oligopeptidase
MHSQKNNPVASLSGINSLPDFSCLTADVLQEQTRLTLEHTRARMLALQKIPSSARFEESFLRMDDMYNHLGCLHHRLDLLSNVSPDESIRQQAMHSLAATEKMFNEIALNVELYQALKPIHEKNRWQGWKQRLADKIMRNFERNGCHLNEPQRQELKKIKDRISELGILFNRNIESEHRQFRFTARQVEGLPESYLKVRQQPEGDYLITLDYPDYYPFMKLCKNAEARKQLYMAFTTRAPANKEVLKELLSLRQEMARLIGFKSYAEYSLQENVAGHPAAVWHFEKTLHEKVSRKARQDYQKLMEIKQAETGDSHPLMPWETAYYTEKLMQRDYQIHSEMLRQYFSLDHVLQGIFTICERLFEIKITETDNHHAWHPEVRCFTVSNESGPIAFFFLDLFPRRNKFSHAACFGITAGKQLDDGSYQKPVAALVCNFQRPSADEPSLLTHDEVETLFHEFGHLMHHLLTRSPVYYFAGTNTAIDFVEVPSQLFENWAWDYESLCLFACHYRSGEGLPEELHRQMVAARQVNSGLFLQQQVFYASLDMTYHDDFNLQQFSTTDAVRQLQNSLTLIPYVEGTHFETSFGHLKDYAAGYYSYMWARIYADDMYYEIRKNGMLDRESGKRYLQMVLEKGATEDEAWIVKNFLGREPRMDAFLELNGITDTD